MLFASTYLLHWCSKSPSC